MTIWALMPLITSLTYAALLVLTLPSVKGRSNRAFAIYLGTAGIWSFTSFMLHLNAPPQQTLFWNDLLVGALVGTLATYYYFIRTYTNKPAGFSTYLGITFVIIITGLSLGGYIVRYAYVVDGILFHDLGISLFLIGAVSMAFIAAVIVQLIQKYRSSAEAIERNRTLYLITGWAILVIGAYTNLISSLDGIPLDHIASLANALIIGYAINRYRLLDIKFVLSRGLAYSSLTLLLTALYMLLLFTLQIFLGTWTGYSSIALAAIFALLVVVLLTPLRNFLQKSIDRLFYRETYDYRQILLRFSHRISNVIDLDELAQSILDPIIKAMHVKQASLLFPEPEGLVLNTRFAQAAKGEAVIRLRLSTGSLIVNWLSSEGRVLRREQIDTIAQLKGLWESERKFLDTRGIELLCPIKSRGNLTGILIIGKKQSDAPYSDDEVDLLMTMAHEAAVAVENASMLDTLKSQQLQVEQLLAQVVLAQEEERKRISLDLHDSVAQWLVAASYHVQTCRHILSGNSNTKVQEELISLDSTLTQSLKELRRVVIGLRPPALDELGLTHALRKSVEDLQADGLEGKFTEIGSPYRLPSSVEIAAYRVIQEALNNIRKHAGATKVNVRLQFMKEKLLVDINDNGKGFDLPRTMDRAGEVGNVGLVGMKQRAEMLGGDIKINTSEDGTNIILTLPIQQPAKDAYAD